VTRALAGAVVAAAVAAAGCGSGKPEPSPSPSGLGAELKAMEQDMNTMREANAAATDVIRAAGDCDAAKPLIAAANARLNEAAAKVQTATGTQTLEALRKKVRDVAENCP
jgi:outer membrane murein-binding lipoprotein Lpp